MAKKFSEGRGVSEKEGKRIGQGQFANMPTEVRMEMYPKNKVPMSGIENDTISGIDQVISSSESKRSKYMSNQK